MSQSANHTGFTTVELLISLFIAAAFIASGFQLFSVVTNDSNEARLRAAAATEADKAIQKRSNTVGNVCGPIPASVTEPIDTAILPEAQAVTTFSCPYGTGAKTTRITVTVNYDTPTISVVRSLDVTQ